MHEKERGPNASVDAVNVVAVDLKHVNIKGVLRLIDPRSTYEMKALTLPPEESFGRIDLRH